MPTIQGNGVQSSMGIGLLNQSSGINILAARPSASIFSPAPRRVSMNDDLDNANNAGTFLTEPRATVGRTSSRTNVGSPDRASAMLRGGNVGKSQSQAEFLHNTAPTFNQLPHNQLVSFNFLTQVPIDDFVIQEHSKASKMSARLKSNASMKIEREL